MDQKLQQDRVIETCMCGTQHQEKYCTNYLVLCYICFFILVVVVVVVDLFFCYLFFVSLSFSGHKGIVNDVIFHPTQPIIASAGVDSSIYLGEISD